MAPYLQHHSGSPERTFIANQTPFLLFHLPRSIRLRETRRVLLHDHQRQPRRPGKGKTQPPKVQQQAIPIDVEPARQQYAQHRRGADADELRPCLQYRDVENEVGEVEAAEEEGEEDEVRAQGAWVERGGGGEGGKEVGIGEGGESF